MARHTGKSVDQIEKDTDRDRFMSGEVAVQYGLIDTVLEQRAEMSAAAKAAAGAKD